MFLKIFTEVNFITALRKTSSVNKIPVQQTLLLPATEGCFVILSSVSEVTEILAWKAGTRKKIREQEYASSKG